LVRAGGFDGISLSLLAISQLAQARLDTLPSLNAVPHGGVMGLPVEFVRRGV